ncbi:MAG: hypothetical protein Q8O24_08500 [Gallionellaceae bacterium]|nr:hypothetical protein [Gallionellaceae bacterium]
MWRFCRPTGWRRVAPDLQKQQMVLNFVGWDLAQQQLYVGLSSDLQKINYPILSVHLPSEQKS